MAKEKKIIVHISLEELKQRLYIAEGKYILPLPSVSLADLPRSLMLFGNLHNINHFLLIGHEKLCDKIEEETIKINDEEFHKEDIIIEKRRSEG